MRPSKPTLDDLKIERGEKPLSTRRTWIIASGLVLLLLLLAVAVWWTKHSSKIEVHTVQARSAGGESADRTVLNASGYVTPRREATVSSKVTGKVVEISIEEGMRVKEGQILARLDDTNVKASLRLTEAQLDAARTALDETRVRLKEAELQLQRTINLTKDRIASQAELDRVEAEAKSLQARLERQQVEVTVAERQVALWQQQMEDTIIRAPFAGIVTSKDAQPGEMISPISAGGGFTRTGICTIVDMDSLEIEIDVNESYINRVEPGQPVEATLDAYPDWKIPSKVAAIIPTADRQKATVRVRVSFDQLEARILPQMAVKVAFRAAAGAGAAGAPLVGVPKTAVQKQDGRDVVFVVQNGRAERRAVSVSGIRADDALISAGVSPGEKVIAEWPKGLKDGAAVQEIKP